jgi:CRISPR-associated protein Csd2
MSNPIQNRYDFVLLLDVQDGNPNGDPDAGNLPRVDPETGHGLVTDVCLKRKVRNYVGIARECQRPFDIYVKEKAVLGRFHTEAFKQLNIQLGEEIRFAASEELSEHLDEIGLPEGIEKIHRSDGSSELVISPGVDKNEIKKWLQEANPNTEIKKLINENLKKSKSRKPTTEETELGRELMCQWFYDIRTFGAVLSLKSAPNCGQVRGPVQLTFARSVAPVVALEHSITRMAVATEAESERQSGGNRTMGRKYTLPYGLYRTHGFISAHLARQTRFSDDDLMLLWESLLNMFEHDRSAARGQMTTRGLYVFKHASALGQAPAHSLFERIQTQPSNGVMREFSNFSVTVKDQDLPDGVSLQRLMG